MSGRRGNDALRQFPGEGRGEGRRRIPATGDAHGLIDVGTAGERIADRTAQAGCRAAERFDFRRMVVRLILEHDEPVFRPALDFGLHDNAAGIDFSDSSKLSRMPFSRSAFMPRVARSIRQMSFPCRHEQPPGWKGTDAKPTQYEH